jgi:3-hydroxyacyl-CoA dehydrogenase
MPKLASDISTLSLHGAVAVLKIDSPPVNALGQAVRVALQEGLSAAIADSKSRAVVIICGGRTFFAGADITEFGKPLQGPSLNDLFALIEASPKPVIAAMHGTALGGGFELALACHYRVAVPSAKVGLPEVSLGLLPGAGGTQRVPRLAGVAAALDLIAFGRPLDATRAKDVGLIDELAPEDALQDGSVAFARSLIERKAPLRRLRDLEPDLDATAAAGVFAEFRRKNERAFKGFKAPENIIRAIEAAVSLPFEQGLEREKELFVELVASTESAAQRHIFFAERAAAKIPGLAGDTAISPVSSVAVVGAGTMGRGIATAFLNIGLPVMLIDRDESAVRRGAEQISLAIRAAAQKAKLTVAEAAQRESLLATSADLAAAGNADLIIEAVFEQLDLKKTIFQQLDGIAKSTAILASNTSFLDLNAIAAVTKRPAQVVGMHFFAPANIMRLLEVVRGKATSAGVLATAMALGRKLGKVAVLSGVCDGFIANRMMTKRAEAADRLILQGPMPWDIDRVMSDYGFPMGPFAMLDLVGLDVVGWDRHNSAGRTVQEVLCEMARWGQKKNGGYYDYDSQRRATPSPVAERVIRDFSAKSAVRQHSYSADEMLEQLLYPVVNEGARILEEGIALRASDIDVALVCGYGWPRYTGGPMFWADRTGLARIVAGLDARGAPSEVSPLLRRLAAEGRGFAHL